MTKSILLTDKSLQAAKVMRALMTNCTEALHKLRVDVDKAADAVIVSNNEAMKDQWRVIALENLLDPEATWGQYRLDLNHLDAHGHVYAVSEDQEKISIDPTPAHPGTMQ